MPQLPARGPGVRTPARPPAPDAFFRPSANLRDPPLVIAAHALHGGATGPMGWARKQGKGNTAARPGPPAMRSDKQPLPVLVPLPLSAGARGRLLSLAALSADYCPAIAGASLPGCRRRQAGLELEVQDIGDTIRPARGGGEAEVEWLRGLEVVHQPARRGE